MLPFQWHHIFIPILPFNLLAFMEAPTPFIIGIHADYQNLISTSNDTNLVYLDTGTIILANQICFLPDNTSEKIENRLKKILRPKLEDMDLAFPEPEPMSATGALYSTCAMQPLSGDHYINTEIKLTFLNFFIDLFKDYRQYISFIRKFPEPVTIFNKAKYIKVHPDAVGFLKIFLETQAFSMFLEQHHQNPFSIFEEVIRAQKRGTPHAMLLNDTGAQEEIVDILSPFEIYSKQESYQDIIRKHKNLKIDPNDNSIFPRIRKGYIPPTVELGKTQRNFQKKEEIDTVTLDIPEGAIEGEITSVLQDSAGSIIESSLKRILSEKPLPQEQFDFLIDLFKLESSRLTFVLTLKKHSDSTRGSVIELKQVYFDQLIEISRTFLEEANNQNDFSSPALFIYLMGCYRPGDGSNEDSMFPFMKDLAIWQNKYFWEAAFFESVARERQSLPDEYKVGQPTEIPWEKLSPEQQETYKTKEANILFGVLGSFAYHMLKTGISASESSSFLLQMCRLCDIDGDQTNDLQTLVSNMQQINETLEPIVADREKQRRDVDSFKLQYFTSSKRSETDSTAVYRRLFDTQKGEKKHFDYADEIRDGYTVRTLYGHTNGVSCMALCYPKLVSGSVNGEIRLWDLQVQSYSEFKFQAHKDRITAILINQDVIISASVDKVSGKK